MPPNGVVVLAECVHEWQAQMILRDLLKAEPAPELDTTLVLGEDTDSVLRVRKTPVWWNVERWSKASLLAAQEDADDLPF